MNDATLNDLSPGDLIQVNHRIFTFPTGLPTPATEVATNAAIVLHVDWALHDIDDLGPVLHVYMGEGYYRIYDRYIESIYMISKLEQCDGLSEVV